MSIEAILVILDNLEKLHMSLLRLAEEKTELLKTGNMEQLDRLMKEEQAHLAAIMQSEAKRQQEVARYLYGQGRPVPNEPTVTDLLETVPAEEQQLLVEARDRLLHAIHDLKRQNDLNQKLAYQSLQFVNLSLDMVRPRPEAVTYSKTEVEGQKVQPNRATFDSQA